MNGSSYPFMVTFPDLAILLPEDAYILWNDVVIDPANAYDPTTDAVASIFEFLEIQFSQAGSGSNRLYLYHLSAAKEKNRQGITIE